MTRKEALQAIKAKMDYYESDKRLRGALETLIPELCESEDERIRKEIIDFIQWAEERGMTRHDYHQAKRPSEWIAYLEKQKEQKPAERSEKDEEMMAKIDCYLDSVIGLSEEEKQDIEKWLKAHYQFEARNTQAKCLDHDDETYRDFIIESLESQLRFCKKNTEGANIAKQIHSATAWLKSKCFPFKPSDEQMEALYSVLEHEAERLGPSKDLQLANSLYDELKKSCSYGTSKA
jgi:hypothetical protein